MRQSFTILLASFIMMNEFKLTIMMMPTNDTEIVRQKLQYATKLYIYDIILESALTTLLQTKLNEKRYGKRLTRAETVLINRLLDMKLMSRKKANSYWHIRDGK